MITMYRTENYGTTIKPVQVVRETNQFVVIMDNRGREQRTAKKSSFYVFHASWEIARDHLWKKAESRVENARRSLQSAHDDLGNIKGMRKPVGTEGTG